MHGAFDVFNRGHVKILHEAQKLGDFVLVGVHADSDVRTDATCNIYRAVEYVIVYANLARGQKARAHECTGRAPPKVSPIPNLATEARLLLLPLALAREM